ncbi:hypothetical protein ILYODFUR_015524, partial [Ilyodon furcidens]
WRPRLGEPVTRHLESNREGAAVNRDYTSILLGSPNQFDEPALRLRDDLLSELHHNQGLDPLRDTAAVGLVHLGHQGVGPIHSP